MKVDYKMVKKPVKTVVIGQAVQSSKNHKIAVRKFHKAQAIFKQVSDKYGAEETQSLLIDMLNAGFTVHESAEYLKGVLL